MSKYIDVDKLKAHIQYLNKKDKYELFDVPELLSFIDSLQQEQTDMGKVSDGYHTFNELYYYRMLYNAAFFNLLPKGLVHKSKRHHTGEECFGGGWFIVMANLPTGQVSNHYELKDWDLFQVPEKEFADEWDGHTPQEAADRLHKYLQQEQPKVDIEKELCEYFEGWRTNYYSETEELLKNNGCTVDIDDVKEIARHFWNKGYNARKKWVCIVVCIASITSRHKTVQRVPSQRVYVYAIGPWQYALSMVTNFVNTLTQERGIDMKFITKASLIPSAKDIDKRFIIPTILANKYAATFVFWKWMITIQWGNFNVRKVELSRPFLPSDLDKAAEEYAWRKEEPLSDGERLSSCFNSRIDAFKAGAEWGAEQARKEK